MDVWALVKLSLSLRTSHETAKSNKIANLKYLSHSFCAKICYATLKQSTLIGQKNWSCDLQHPIKVLLYRVCDFGFNTVKFNVSLIQLP